MVCLFHTTIIINRKNWRITIKLHFENLSIFFLKSERTYMLGTPLPLFAFARFSMTSPPQRTHFLNNPYKSIVHSSMHHFADDTNILLTDKSLKKINKFVNHDLKHLCQWMRSNKLSLNGRKTEIIFFKNKKQTITKTC